MKMKKICLLLFLSIAFMGCRRMLYREYRDKDYYLLKGGTYTFFEKEKTFDVPVLQEIYNSTTYDTCSCISVVNQLDSITYFNQLLIGIQFKVAIYSRNWYSAFPTNGSIEQIENISVWLKNKKELVNISSYLNNDLKLRANVIPTQIDSMTYPFNKSIYFNYTAHCLKGYAVKNLNDFRDQFNNKKFDDDSNTVNWYKFLFSVSADCSYKTKDYDTIITLVNLKTAHTKRSIRIEGKIRTMNSSSK
jgi:hypothetical protein